MEGLELAIFMCFSPNDRVVKLTDVRCSMLFELQVAVERCVMETSALETGELRFEWEV